jgi:hypothetical protein
MVGAPDYKVYVKYSTQIKTTPNSSFELGPYLAGLWEGDGHIWISKISHAPCGKRYIPHFAITFNYQDKPLCTALQSVIGGYIRNKKENNAYVLTLSSISDLSFVANLMNGYLRTPKIHRFNQLLDWLNENYIFPIVRPMYIKHDVDISPILRNAWLAGFIDADGSFDVKVRHKNTEGIGKNRVEVRMRLEQRQFDPSTGLSNESVLQMISQAFQVQLGTSTHNQDKIYYVIAVTSPSKLRICLNYFSKNPLMSSKRMNYLDFKICVEMMLEKKHLNAEGRMRIMEIKACMNKGRLEYNWDHLKILSSI